MICDSLISKQLSFSVPVLCLEMFTVKLIFRPTVGLTYAISIINLIFDWNSFIRQYFCFSALILNYWCSIIMLRHSEILNLWNLLKLE